MIRLNLENVVQQPGDLLGTDFDPVLLSRFVQSGVDFQSIDGHPTRLFITLLAPENSAGVHLQALARISRLFKNGDFRRRLLEAATQDEVIHSRYQLLVTGVSDPIKSGIPSSVTVQAVDVHGLPLNDYTGTIHFSSSDGLAALPDVPT